MFSQVSVCAPGVRVGTWDTTVYGRQAGGTHPTGMLSSSLCSQEAQSKLSGVFPQ